LLTFEILDEDQLLRHAFPRAVRNLEFEERSGICEPARQQEALLSQTEGADTLKAGQGYRIYAARDLLGKVSEELERVIGRGAQWVGVEEEYVWAVLEKFEKRLVHWWTRREAQMRRKGDEE
jgi:hypothetical protein